MPVYVDDMYKRPMGRLGRMKLSHMYADTTDELYDMARQIGLNTAWVQYDSVCGARTHFDVSMAYRKLAIENGAIEITMREMATKRIEWQRQWQEQQRREQQ